MNRSLVAATVLTAGCATLVATLSPGRDPLTAPAVRAPRTLPGTQADGFIQLPNQWRLRPAGTQIEVGDFPVNIALHPDGRFAAVLHAGYRDHEIVTLSLGGLRPKVVSRAVVDQAFVGLCFSPDGKVLFASGGEYEVVHAFEFQKGYLTNPREIPVADRGQKFVVSGVTVSPDGKTLYVPGVLGNAVAVVPVDDPGRRKTVSLDPLGKSLAVSDTGPSFRENETERAVLSPNACYPYSCLAEPGGKRLFVSVWNKAAVAVIDLSTNAIAGTWPTERHPTEMALSPGGKTLYVACSNSTRVSVLDAESGKGLQTIECSLYPGAPNGSTPNSLCLTPDGELLFVANADNNTVAVFNVAERGEAKPQGFIPVGWYPTSVRYHAGSKRLLVANGKGMSSRANRNGPQPTQGRTPATEYIPTLFNGTVAVIDLPSPTQMANYSKTAYRCSPLRADAGVVGDVPANNPVPAKLGDASPIKHVIYIVKENRTYDQVFGDMKEGNGAQTRLFPESVTPNHHKLAREFVLLDNTYVDGEVSADGHEWSMGAYATDFVEKTWPLTYRTPKQGKLTYPAEGAVESLARPAGGYIWDRCAEAGVTYRSYGEWVHNAKNPGDPGVAAAKTLEGHFDPQYRSFDMDYPDVKRAARFIDELARFEREDAMPQFIVLRLPNDHTFGTRVGKPTPTAMVADNDVALGRLIEAVSKSKFWKETAVFVIEDDAQNGPDHVDAHRTVALVISPYTKRGFVDSTMYSTTSLLRTMELILGLKPMSQYDAAARPMYNAFQPTPDDRPYAAVEAKADLGAKNTATAWGADLSEKFDLTKEDLADDLLFNEIIWRSVRGANSAMPPPVRAAWVFPHAKAKDDDDDDDDG